MTVLEAIKLNIYTLRTLRNDESAAYSALVRTSDSSARETEGDDSAAPESGWTVTTISLCQIRWTTFLIEYAHANGTPPLACIAQSASVLSNVSAACAGTVVDHMVVPTYCCRHASRSRRAYPPTSREVNIRMRSVEATCKPPGHSCFGNHHAANSALGPSRVPLIGF